MDDASLSYILYVTICTCCLSLNAITAEFTTLLSELYKDTLAEFLRVLGRVRQNQLLTAND